MSELKMENQLKKGDWDSTLWFYKYNVAYYCQMLDDTKTAYGQQMILGTYSWNEQPCHYKKFCALKGP